jgi:hypothetical protein
LIRLMMELTACKSEVQGFFRSHGGFVTHIDNGQLIVAAQGFRIQPDDTYIFKDWVIVIEYEATKRPVESISKYWWLLEKTKWKSLNMRLSCLVLLLRPDLNDIRKESVLILGEELAARYPGLFSYRCLIPSAVSGETILGSLHDMCRHP